MYVFYAEAVVVIVIMMMGMSWESFDSFIIKGWTTITDSVQFSGFNSFQSQLSRLSLVICLLSFGLLGFCCSFFFFFNFRFYSKSLFLLFIWFKIFLFKFLSHCYWSDIGGNWVAFLGFTFVLLCLIYSLHLEDLKKKKVGDGEIVVLNWTTRGQSFKRV